MNAIKYTLLLLLLTASVITNAQVFNGNFETLDHKGLPLGWDLNFQAENKYEIKLDSLVKKQGKYSVSIASGAQISTAAIVFPIQQSFDGENLILIGTIKTENVSGGFAGVWIRLEDANGKELVFETMESQGLKGTNDWKEYMIQVPYDGREAVKISAGALLVGKGKMWVDSMRLLVDYKSVNDIPVSKTPPYAALTDTAFRKGSGITHIILNSKSTAYLTLLGEVWGFLKYHHPAIARGEFNWDAELFRILPAVLKCTSDQQFSVLLGKWTDRLGLVPPCNGCKIPPKEADIAAKPNYGTLFTNKVFSPKLSGKLKYILANSNNSKHFYAGPLRSPDRQSFFHEDAYNDIKTPDAGYRLLALYRYWSMIQYFGPNRQFITEDWTKVLPGFIPQILQAGTISAYTDIMVRLISTIHDGHAFIGSEVYQHNLGKFKLPFQARFIEDKLLVTAFYKDTLGVKQKIRIGDVITSINGEKMASLIRKYVALTPASNYPTALRDIPANYLLRNNDSLFRLDLLRDGKLISLTQKGVKNHLIDDYYWKAPAIPAYSLMDGNIGYIHCAKYKNTDLDSIKKQFKDTKGIIVDMRNYPIDEMRNTLGGYFKPDSSVFVKYSFRSISQPGTFVYRAESSGTKTDDYYKGKVIILVNETTQSNAELVTMSFQSGANVKVIGSTTAGADGDITRIILPGGLTTFVSGLGVYYPDGKSAQSAGVKIDQVVKPTIAGVKQGRDEVLERAKQLILQN